MKKKQKFPAGWNESKVRKVIAHYENQTEDHEFVEIEAAHKNANITMMAVPTELVPQVRAFLAQKRSA
jgi:predicted dinucleotide-binding enzyme